MIPPSAYDENVYTQEVLSTMRKWETKVFDGVFSPDGDYFLACNASGHVSCWRFGLYLVIKQLLKMIYSS